MKYNELNLTAAPSRKRVGRGISAGQGKTAGRGTKGQNSRTGSHKKPGFEGGQNPLYARLPKLPGFKSFKLKKTIISTSVLEKKFKTGASIDLAEVIKLGLVNKQALQLKVVFDKPLSKAFNVSAQGVSEKAKNAIENAGGTVSITARPKMESVSKNVS